MLSQRWNRGGMCVASFIKDENTISGDRKKRASNPKLKIDSQRWRRKRATIGKYLQEKFGMPVEGRGIELDINNPKR